MFNIHGMLTSAGDRMRLDLAQRLTSHPGELGVAREEVIRRFLRAYLPARFEVSTGFAFDVHGNVSQQLDVIVANSLVCPRFEGPGGTRFYPCESVVAVGQVKSSVSSRAELHQAIANLASAKSLDRSAKGAARDIVSGRPLDHRGDHLDQIFSFILVTGSSLAGDTVRIELLEHVTRTDPHLWPNLYLALDQYLITYGCDEGVCPNPMHARGVALQPSSEAEDLVLRFYLLLARALDSIRVSGLAYWEHLYRPWSADIWYSTASEPPPLLREVLR